MAHARCMLDKATRAQAHARARAPTPTHAHVNACTHLGASTHTQWCRKRASKPRYTYIACLVNNIISLLTLIQFCHKNSGIHT